MLEVIVSQINEPRKDAIPFKDGNLTPIQVRAYRNGFVTGYRMRLGQAQELANRYFNDWLASHHLGKLRDRLGFFKEELNNQLSDLEERKGEMLLKNNREVYGQLREQHQMVLSRMVKLNKLIYIVCQAQQYCQAKLPFKRNLNPLAGLKACLPLRNRLDPFFIKGEQAGADFFDLNLIHESITCDQAIIKQSLAWGMNSWLSTMCDVIDSYQQKIAMKLVNRTQTVVEQPLSAFMLGQLNIVSLLDNMDFKRE
ncbi:hypothetical protein VIBNIFTn2_120033 [Vibrio nigripulchritudo FTn2]|uniref:hypothetical protein n=1 Tax=Vibrio nigripulchritudo TaxID=28173 RepID=UPI0003B1C903|nr:hypothetical protein [Vibrio nigripulchritudo]CCN40051.1 hypothetical protein VIBNIFTn2_120033 [Vibrio nigripulchritudo FTn2]